MAPITSEEENATVQELIQRFEKDIYFDAHSFSARYGRSAARKELEKRGFAVVTDIIDHIWEGKGIRDQEVKEAWTHLLCVLCKKG